MSESVPLARRRWQVRVWAFLLVPVVCATVFYYLAMRRRLSPEQRAKRQWQWVMNAIKTEFSPLEGEPVESGDMLFIVAGVHYDGYASYSAISRWVMPEGTIHCARNTGSDAWVDHGRARADSLSRLPALLRALPPSDPAAPPTKRMIVAFPDQGRWVVRTYRLDSVPKEIKDLEKALEVPTS